jgi:hypothetical protein
MVFGLVELRQHRRDHAAHDTVGGFQHGDVNPGLAAGGGDFQSDVPAADDDGATTGMHLPPQPVDVRRGPEVVDAGQLGAGHRQQLRLAAGGQQQLLVLEVRPVRDLDAMRGAVEADRRETQPQVHGMLRVVVGVTDQQTILLEGARQIFLGQRRTLIGQHAFIAYQRERTGVTTLAQSLDRLRGGLAGSDNEDGTEHAVEPYI